MKKDKEIATLIDKMLSAVEAEIEAVRERPARDVLFGGNRKKDHPPGSFYYEFNTQNTAFKYAEVVEAELEGVDKALEIHPVEIGEKTVTFDFPHNVGETIEKVSLEWENDYVLRRLYHQLERLQNHRKSLQKVRKLFYPATGNVDDSDVRIVDDNSRNESQQDALVKSVNRRVLFVWGPPGTGKTSTLGYIIANYLLKNQRVLFVSNTNRAVDVGVLSVLEALIGIEKEHIQEQISRYGEIALDHPRLEEVHFQAQMQQLKEQREQKAARLGNTLDRYRALQNEIDELINADDSVPAELEERCVELRDQLDEQGGPDAVEEQIEQLMLVNEREELAARKLVATTLAKVCTAEALYDMEFDAVVVDEASMANLPYLAVMAARARRHMVAVGDPMQLPPIAVTPDREARELLEMDIFTFVSEADTAEDLFNWHDENRSITAFFDTQYRMKQDLADILSSVFYEGRLRTVQIEQETRSLSQSTAKAPSIALMDTGKYGASLTQKDRGRGFSPVNEVHQYVLLEACKKLVIKNGVLPSDIGIIVPFRSAVYDIRGELRERGFGEVEVGTIHTFQGREKKYIIFDTIMSGEMRYGRKQHYSVRPFDEEKNGLAVYRLLNVALSRSREKLVILADMEHVEKVYGNKLLGRLLQQFKGNSS